MVEAGYTYRNMFCRPEQDLPGGCMATPGSSYSNLSQDIQHNTKCENKHLRFSISREIASN